MNEYAWPHQRLHEALYELLLRSRLTANAEGSGAPPKECDITSWLTDMAARRGCEAEQVRSTMGDLPEALVSCYPALLRLPEHGYLVVLGVRGRRIELLAPDLRKQRVAIADVCRALRGAAEEEHRPALDKLFATAQISPRIYQRLLNEQLAKTRFCDAWILRTDPGASPALLLRQAGVIGNGLGMLGAHTVQSFLWLASWALLGSLSLAGRLERGWIWAWVLLLFTLVPCQIVTTWMQGLFAIGLGGFLKRRLLCGAMKLGPEEMRHNGAGTFLGQALEAEAVETLALSGGLGGVLASIEIAMALFVLGRFAPVLLAWCGLTAFAGWRFLRRYHEWTERRMEMTEDLVETMVGHRTRLAQLNRREWHSAEDAALHRYLGVSKALDAAAAWLIGALPRSWLLAGIACLLPSVLARQTADNSIGLLLGGVLLAYSALRKLTGSFADVGAAWVAFQRIAPLFRAAARTEALGEQVASEGKRSHKVLEADRLSFRYRPAGRAALQSGSLCVFAGDKILLEGPSGGGKTTFASLLSGMREPESGLLLSNGLDRKTLGRSRWRKRIAAAPQFHENHILTETLAFNLLLSREWPPTQADMEEAETVCRELGLGTLLDVMPAGLMQMVGEGGWQLSHGEKSRVFIARALLQSADLVILDESFAALDPENAKLALETTIARAPTLLVIAHP